ncbi:DUF4400 domain-containing protein [Photobacterium lutimaris]|uniref:TIGR03747 family integrating conjugative element membrane protein n=1 Tax=Photobacterium lutimaris TaxID=388278 RepID=A0A2T3ITW4_9GAMM|nr:DUF4400 domain-containing protein [Photobacterium lutimaris]PSU31805.1 hypothetical protein C9I99_21715 [Photobacterium lutimaris]TDR72543.1 uncharacterized protein DUF4400 [Photobacterium lutimaris]
MAEKASKQQSSSAKKKPVSIPIITVGLAFLSKHFGLALLAGFFGLLISFGLYIYNPQTGLESAINHYESAISNSTHVGKWLDVQYVFELLTSNFNQYVPIEEVLNTTYSISDRIANGYSQSFSRFPTIENFVSSGSTHASNLIYLWIVNSLTWVIKLLILIGYLPIYILFALAGINDGYMERRIKTYQGERDKDDPLEFWFRRFKEFSLLVLLGYLAIPNSVIPGLVFIPSAFATAYIARQLVRYYKKFW